MQTFDPLKQVEQHIYCELITTPEYFKSSTEGFFKNFLNDMMNISGFYTKQSMIRISKDAKKDVRNIKNLHSFLKRVGGGGQGQRKGPCFACSLIVRCMF